MLMERAGTRELAAQIDAGIKRGDADRKRASNVAVPCFHRVKKIANHFVVAGGVASAANEQKAGATLGSSIAP
jgi:hypothetical protein